MTTKLTRAHIVPGAIVVVGPALLPNGGMDRSWCGDIWRVEATSGDFILCRRMSRLSGYADVIHMSFKEREWWAGEHILDAYNLAKQEASIDYNRQRQEDTRA